MTDGLPAGWAEVALSDVCRSVSQRGPSAAEAEFRYIDLGAIDNKTKRVVDPSTLATAAAPSRAKQVVAAGDVLFSTVRVYLENIALIPSELEGAIASTAFTVLRPTLAVEPGYLYRWVTSKPFIQAVNALQRGNSPPSVQDGDVRSQRLPLPPLPEQQRIVSRIEELFSEIDEGERALERVGRLVERYRQSVLKAAVTGELTFDWRDPRASGARVEARDDQFGQLPPGWDWMPLGELIESGPQNGVYLHQSAYGEGSPIVRIDDFQPGWLRPASELRRVRADAETVGRYSLQEADIVVNRVNSPSHLGKCFLASREHAGALFESNMMRFRVRDRLLPAYLELYLRSEVGRRRLTANCKHAVNQASINQKDVAATPVPLPPVAEQHEIVDRVDCAVSDIAATEETITISAAGTSALRQSILKAAFSGQLVPQDPRDEPASALLARVAAQASAAPPVPKRRGRPPRQAATPA